MNEPRSPQHPGGSVQALSTASMSLLTILIAFIGYANFRDSGTWHPVDVVYLLCAALAGISLVCVPIWATRAAAEVVSIGRARQLLTVGAVFVLASIFIFLGCDFFGHLTGAAHAKAKAKPVAWVLLAYFTTPQVGMSANGELMGVHADERSCSTARRYVKAPGAELKCVQVPLGITEDATKSFHD